MLPHGNSVKRKLRHYVESGQVDKARETLNDVCRERLLDSNQYKQLLLDAEQTRDIPMIKLLLEHYPGNCWRFQGKQPSALWLAILYGYEKSAELLVRSGSVDLNEPLGVNYQGGYEKEWNVLHALLLMPNLSWTNRYIALVVDHGADLEVRDSRGRTPLHYTVSKDKVKMTRWLLEKGANVNVADNDGETPLLMAAKRSSRGNSQAEELLLLLMKHGADVTAKNLQGRDALYHLTNVHGEHIDLARVLIEKGADLKNRDLKGQTVLHIAVKRDHFNITELLLEKGADVNVADNAGETALLIAAKSISKADELLTLLMRYGADVTAKNSRGCNVLYNLTDAPGEHVDLARALIEKGALLNGCTDQHMYSFEPLRRAICLFKYKLVKLYLDNGADLNNRDSRGKTVLHCAVALCQVRVTELLLERGAVVNVADNLGETPLLVAVRSGKVDELVPLLVRHGADVTVKDSRGCNILYHLTNAPGERIDLARVLIEKGADVKNRDSKAQTVLHIAVRRGHVKMTELLLEKGADINVADNNGETPLLVAVRSTRANKLLPLLLKHGADVNFAASDGETPLLVTVRSTRVNELLPLLLKHGADINLADNDGETPLLVAARSTRANELLPLLLKHGADVNVADNDGETPLLVAVRNARANELLPLLIEHGADITARDSQGSNALHHLTFAPLGCEKVRVDLAIRLIESGVSPNDRLAPCPLILTAVLYKRSELVNLYLDHGADVNSSTANGHSLLHKAAVSEDPRALETLLKYGASVDLRTHKGRTALHYACKKFRQPSISMLLAADADILVEDKYGKTPFALIEKKDIKNWCIMLMLQKLALIRARHPSIEMKDEMIIKGSPQLWDYYQDCFIDIAKMKSVSLTNTSSFFDLLAKSHREISELMWNHEFRTNFKFYKLGVLSIYKACFIRQAFARAECHHRSSLKQQDLINEAVFYILPDLVVRRVLRYMFYDCCRSLN